MFGILSDKQLIDRRWILIGAIVVWSLASALAGFAKSLATLILFRALIGIGEGAFVTISPVILTDYYPKRERNTMFGFYWLSLPVGGALGFGLGAVIGQSMGWREAFWIVGFPGILGL